MKYKKLQPNQCSVENCNNIPTYEFTDSVLVKGDDSLHLYNHKVETLTIAYSCNDHFSEIYDRLEGDYHS